MRNLTLPSCSRKDRAEQQAQNEARADRQNLPEAQRRYESRPQIGSRYWSTKTTGQRVDRAVAGDGCVQRPLAKPRTGRWTRSSRNPARYPAPESPARTREDCVEGRKTSSRRCSKNTSWGRARSGGRVDRVERCASAAGVFAARSARGRSQRQSARADGQIDQRLGQLNLTIAQKNRGRGCSEHAALHPARDQRADRVLEDRRQGPQRYALEQQKLGSNAKKIGADDGKNIVVWVGRA